MPLTPVARSGPLPAPLRHRPHGSRWLLAALIALSACEGALASPPRAARTAPAATAATTPVAVETGRLPTEVEAALQRAKVPREALSVVVADVTGGVPRLSLNASQSVNPASLMKLVTTQAALDLLGPAFTWRTPVFVDGPIRDGVLQGNLYLKGSGDPRLTVERLWLLLRRVQGLGIARIQGDIVLDRSAFDVAPRDPASFDGEALRPYNAAPDALLINFKSLLLSFTPERGGTVARVHAEPPLAGVQLPTTVPLSREACEDWRGGLRADWSDPLRVRLGGSYPAACGERVWPVAYAAPAHYAARAVAGLWQQLGGQLAGQVREGTVPAGLTPSLIHESAPLAEVVRDINKFSNNVMAQQLYLSLSAQRLGQGSFEASREVVQAWWRERLGDTPPVLDNGSGLSRDERISAQALARLLQHAWAQPTMPELMASLPLTGLDGTLKRSRAQASAHLKTGSLRDVAGIAGYVDGPGARRWVLVAILHHPNANAARAALDGLIDWTGQQP